MVTLLERPRIELLQSIDFELPLSLEAREPPEARGLARDEVRLMVSHREDDRVVDATFRDLPEFLDAGDLLVVNDSATLPAALTAVREDGSEMALHLSTQLASDLWVVEPRQVSVRQGEGASLPGGGAALFLTPYRESLRLWVAQLELPDSIYPYLHTWGRPIKYPYLMGEWPIETYQTVYARRPGSAEMPSAGRAFSARVIQALEARGVLMAAITLHAGVGSLEDHEAPYEEWFEVTEETTESIRAARSKGNRVIAVGTTVVRALESASDEVGRVWPAQGLTDLVITPERGVRSADALLTGFHEPRASHLAMLEAFADRRHLEAAYTAALDRGYLWHEFGDLHLIL